MEAASVLVKQRSMEALDKLRTYTVDTRRGSTLSSISGHASTVHSAKVMPSVQPHSLIKCSLAATILSLCLIIEMLVITQRISLQMSPCTPRSRRATSTSTAPINIISNDPVMMDTAAKFVQDIIDKAKNEATKNINNETLEMMGIAERSKYFHLFIFF